MPKFFISASAAWMVLLVFAAGAEPIFPNSIVSNDLDFIIEQDPHVFECLDLSDRDRREMPDKRNDELFADDAFIFTAHFRDGAKIEIWTHPDFDTVENARQHVRMIVEPLGRLPSFMRQDLSHVVLHEGDETAFAEHLGRFFVLYSENLKQRTRSHDIEETLFHEAVHATLDADYGNDAGWIDAQQSDGAYITRYAADLPEKEDFAESALFAYTLLQHPGRLPERIEQAVKALMPNRLAYFSSLFEKLDKAVTGTDRPSTCSP